MQAKKKPRGAAELTFERSSGNVFADLGLENADELLVKADLAHAINSEIRSRDWTQAEAAERTGLTQSDVSRVGQMKTDGFSQERLQNALRRLGIDVEIRIHRRRNGGIGTLKVRKVA
jgi:predicted XRE-type DNA-binding protein